MNTQRNFFVIFFNKIKTLTAVFVVLFSAFACAGEADFLPPYPTGSMKIQLSEAPSSAVLSMYAIPTQDARVHSPFNLPLSPYVGSTPIEFRYMVTNEYKNTKTSNLKATNTSLQGLPAGVFQSVVRAGDCPINFVLPNRDSCLLHLYVDRNQYTSSKKAFGPRVDVKVFWLWGKHKDYPNTMEGHVTVAAPDRIVDLLPAVMRPIKLTVTPAQQAGLQFDPQSKSIKGTPTQAGIFSFKVSASDGNSTSAALEVLVRVDIDPKDTPVFKINPSIASAMPNQAWQLNLMDLLEPRPGFMVSNQVSFRIEKNLPHPDWLSIDEKNPTILKGRASSNQAGQTESITLIATSNTGGESQPMTINIPVAFDPAKKPRIHADISLAAVAGSEFHHDFRASISDPTQDGNLQILLDRIEPATLDLKISPYNPTEVFGVIDDKDEGKEYKLVLRAKTAVGGVSDPVTVPLNIAVNRALTPRFYQDNPNLTSLYPGQSFSHNFVDNRDVYPEYKDIPYVVELAKGADNPIWLRIEDNKLIVDEVPDNLPQKVTVYVTIKNVPGGQSEVYPISLYVAE